MNLSSEITVLLLSTLLLLAHIMLAIRFKTKQYGTDWNMGARDEDLPPLNDIAARLERARDNFLETYPIAIIALLVGNIYGQGSSLIGVAAWVWLAARAIYLPLYWAGIPKVRTLVWAVGILALLAIIVALLLI
ncbi:MAPEG family protein [Aurantiacibacter suaedae]|uniref:MAPEG family protein n=1 Tax=Aurantiacibacter suaedae TaxID=2545755 RepID=UPI0030C7F33F